MTRRVRSGLVALIACLCCAAVVRADEASGTWTGEFEARANYFWERSTRVIPPSAKVTLEAPNGVRLKAGYLMDVISSASIAQTGGGSDAVFTELRHAVTGGAGKAIAIGNNELDLFANVIYSTEDDYKSWIYGASGSFSWNDKNSTLRLGLTRVDDTILNNGDANFRRNLGGLTTSLGFSQVLSPVLIAGLGYQFVYLQGFLGNPYRRVLIEGQAPIREDPPEERFRHNVEGYAAWFLPRTETTLRGHLRFYGDSWHVRAITPELRVYQRLTADLNARIRYRFYGQSRAEFALPAGQPKYLPPGYTGPTTNDPKLTKFHSHQVGLRLEYALSLFSGTFLSFAQRAVIDLSFDYQWCTSSFGNNVIATAGGRLPF